MLPTMIRLSGRGAWWLAGLLSVSPHLGEAPAAARTQAPRAAARIELTVVSEPAGAEVSVESLTHPGWRRGGRADGALRLLVPAGTCRIEARLPRHRPLSQVLAVTQPRRLKLTLEPAVARLDVATPGSDDTARGGEIRIDGRLAGVVPVPVEVTAGRHLVEVSKPGYRPFREALEVDSGESRTLWVALQAEVRSGSLLVSASAGPARVFVDGQERGPAPLLLDNLPEGEHQIELRSAAATTQRRVRVIAGQQLRLTLP